MKKLSALLFIAILLAFSLVACGGGDDNPTVYTVKFDSDGAGKYSSLEIEEGGKVTLPDTPVRDGYHFVGWYNGETIWDFDNNTVTTDITLVAKWQRVNYTVSFETGSDSVIKDQIIPSGDKAVEPADPQKAGYRFLGWYNVKNDTLWNFEDPVASDLTLSAKWELIVIHTVTFNSDGGSTVASSSVESGEKVSEPVAPTKDNYHFVGWYNGETLWDFENNAVTSNITLTAKWQRINYVVTFDAANGSATFDQVAKAGDKLLEPEEPQRADYKFLGWYNGSAKWDFNTPVSSKMTLVAKWEQIIRYTVTFDSNGGTAIDDKSVVAGEKVTAPTPPTRAEYRFLGWYLGEELWNFETPITTTITLVAEWERVVFPQYEVIFDTVGGSAISKQTITEGDLASEPVEAPEKTGYKFTGWFDSNGNPWNFSTPITEPITLVAGWEALPEYTVTFDSNGGSSVQSVTVYQGGIVSRPTDPTYPTVSYQEQTATFLGWYNGNEKWDFRTPITDDITLTAKWSVKISYKITYSSESPVTYNAVEYINPGEKAPVPSLTTPAGYKFLGWYNGSTLWNFDTAPTSNITLVAKWKKLSVYTVTFDSNGGSSVDQQRVEEGSKINRPTDPTYPTASDKEVNATFLGWYNGNAKWDFNTPVTGPVNLVAKWNITISYKITYVSDGTFIYAERNEIITPGQKAPNQEVNTPEGYRFLGWFNGNEKWNFDTVPTSNMTLTARWEKVPTYKVTFDSQGGSSVDEKNIQEGHKVSIPAEPTKENHRFDGWLYNGKPWDFANDVVTGNVTLTAKWVERVKVKFNTGTEVVIPAIELDKGEFATAPTAPVRENYRFDGWLLDGVKWDFNSSVVNETITLTAKWVRQYTVTFDTDCELGTFTQIVDEGSRANKISTPVRGDTWSFEGWFIKDSDTEWILSESVVTYDVELVARWSIMTPPDIW